MIPLLTRDRDPIGPEHTMARFLVVRGQRMCRWLVIVHFFFFVMIVGTGHLSIGDELEKRATWSAPHHDEITEELLMWLSTKEADVKELQALREQWVRDIESEEKVDLLTLVVKMIAHVEPEAREVFDLTNRPSFFGFPPQFELLQRIDIPPLLRNNIRLFHARWLANQEMYNESQIHLEGLQPEGVVDPATLLFYQALVAYRLIDKDNCLDTIGRLLEREQELPRRYAEIARLMQADIELLKDESLDEIARIMRNIRHRLDLGRAGKRVRTEEEEVLEKLQKMIEEIEQQQNQARGEGAGTGANRSSMPASDSIPLGGKGPGDVDPKPIGNKSGWGDLPPKDRQETLQQISRDFPSHYREVIEEYFKKIARDGSD